MKINKTQQRGNILVTSILVVLVMTLLGVGLSHTLNLQVKKADVDRAATGALLAAESCVYEQVQWLTRQRGLVTGAGNNPIAVIKDNLVVNANAAGDLALAATYNALPNDYAYSCSVRALAGLCTVAIDVGVGGNAGDGASYRTRRCYEIPANATSGGQLVNLLVTVSKG
jgi:Tfp pilus assembly protein PilX